MKNQDTNSQSKVKKIIAMASKHELFHDENKECYITILDNNHHITYPIKSQLFRDWLQQQFFCNYNEYIATNNLREAIDNIGSQAKFSKIKHSVYKRVAEVNNEIYIDLGNQNYDYIKIREGQWTNISNPPVKFLRTPLTQALPLPIPGKGNFSLLWRNINIQESQRILIMSWLLESWRTSTAFPILFLTGHQGSAKSTTQEILKKLIDPSSSNLRGAPKKSDDLMVAAANNYLISFNNLSYLSSAQQDEFCCISTGGGYATRELYTTCEEMVVNIKRPTVMNGISEVITAPDLIERSIILHLPQIDSTQRMSDSDLTQQFNQDYPLIFTGLLDLMAQTMGNIKKVNLTTLPRMADFAKLGTAIEITCGLPENIFIDTFIQNQHENEALNIESSPIIISLINFISKQINWEGTYQELYNNLSMREKNGAASWPKSPKGLSEALKRHDSYLRKTGIKIQRGKRTHQGYLVCISTNIKEKEN